MPEPFASLAALPRHLLRLWRERDEDQAWMGWLGLALLASGLAHVVVQLVLGGPLTGPVSWRKPIVFGLSGGLTTLSLGWIIGGLPATRRRRMLVRLYVVTIAVEVAIITAQAWRGVASHFNLATPIDAVLWGTMGLLILAASISMLSWTWQVCRQPADDRADHLARAMSMLLLTGSLAVGFWMSSYGTRVTAGEIAATDPSTFGAAGWMKLPHAVGFHAIQLLPLLAFIQRRAGLSARARMRGMTLASAGHGGLMLLALAQTLQGRVPWDLAPGMMAGLALSLALVLLPFGLTRRPSTASLAPHPQGT